MKKTPIIWLCIDDLQQWKENPNDGDVGSIMGAIKEFGFNDVSAIWNDIIKGGNHRMQALHNLRKEGWKPEDCKHPSQFLNINDDLWAVGCFDVSHMQEHEADAFALALNRTARLGYDDPSSLLSILENIHTTDPSILDSTGYTLEDMDYLNDITEKQTALQLPISTGRILGDASKQIRPVIYMDEISTFEKALRLTKEKNRGQALMKICLEYIQKHGKG